MPTLHLYFGETFHQTRYDQRMMRCAQTYTSRPQIKVLKKEKLLIISI